MDASSVETARILGGNATRSSRVTPPNGTLQTKSVPTRVAFRRHPWDQLEREVDADSLRGMSRSPKPKTLRRSFCNVFRVLLTNSESTCAVYTNRGAHYEPVADGMCGERPVSPYQGNWLR